MAENKDIWDYPMSFVILLGSILLNISALGMYQEQLTIIVSNYDELAGLVVFCSFLPVIFGTFWLLSKFENAKSIGLIAYGALTLTSATFWFYVIFK